MAHTAAAPKKETINPSTVSAVVFFIARSSNTDSMFCRPLDRVLPNLSIRRHQSMARPDYLSTDHGINHSQPQTLWISPGSRWSVRTLAGDLGLAPATVHDVLVAAGLQPHRVRTFTFSPDPEFEANLLAIVGLYPPTTRWCCVSIKKRGSRRWTTRNPG